MNESIFAPILVPLMFILRFLIPIAVLVGVAYLIRKSGLAIIERPEDPNEDNEDKEEADDTDVQK